MRLAYQDLSVQQKKQEEKLKTTNPKKAQQMERLGMGFGGRRYVQYVVVYLEMYQLQLEHSFKTVEWNPMLTVKLKGQGDIRIYGTRYIPDNKSNELKDYLMTCLTDSFSTMQAIIGPICCIPSLSVCLQLGHAGASAGFPNKQS